jgi:hypothetical protein
MDLREIIDEKNYLEVKIGQLIEDFEGKTGTILGDTIKIIRGQDETRPTRISIGLQVLIP